MASLVSSTKHLKKLTQMLKLFQNTEEGGGDTFTLTV